MGTEQQDTELTNVVLCYQALGAPLDATPAQIEQLYKTLTEEHKKKLAVADPALREDARKSLEQIDEMYDKIRNSVTYRSAELEHQKRPDVPVAEIVVKRPPHQSVTELKRLNPCPYCNALISRGIRTCPVCKHTLYSLPERVLRACFTPKKVIIYCILLAVIASVGYFLSRQQDVSAISDINILDQPAPK